MTNVFVYGTALAEELTKRYTILKDCDCSAMRSRSAAKTLYTLHFIGVWMIVWHWTAVTGYHAGDDDRLDPVRALDQTCVATLTAV